MTDIILDEKALEAAREAYDYAEDYRYDVCTNIGECIEAAIKAYKANEVDDGWMDIESAPRDGSKFDIWYKPDTTSPLGERYTDISYSKRLEDYWCPSVGKWLIKSNFGEPSHWRPLPNPAREGEMSSSYEELCEHFGVSPDVFIDDAECASCSYLTTDLTIYNQSVEGGKKRKAALCECCAETMAGLAYAYPSQFPDAEILKQNAYLANMVLAEIRKRK